MLAHSDDAVSLGTALTVDHSLDCLEERLAHHGWTLFWEKSHAWIPGWMRLWASLRLRRNRLHVSQSAKK